MKFVARLAPEPASPRWFGPSERPLFGWLHRPAGDDVRALVVMCPSLGQEAVFSHYLLRSTADELAAQGFAVVRFDYDGTGDSLGDEHDPDRVAAWLTSVEHAIALGREHTDAPLALFGFRLGALLAAEAATRSDAPVHSLALWDPPRSGRQFLREQVMRHNASVGEARNGPDGVTALGLSLTAGTRADVTRLDLRRHDVLPAATVLVLGREQTPGPDAVRRRDGAPADYLEAADQDSLLSRQALPVQSRRALLDWYAATYPAAAGVLHHPSPAAGAVVHDGVREQVTTVGPNGLFGIVTEPATGPTFATTVVFVPDSITPHTGLSRIWTELARQWATLGVRSLRFDLAGCADSPTRDGLPPHTVGLLAHLDDATDALRHANPADPGDTVVVGLCSGAYLSLEAALALRPRAVAMVNPVLSFITPEARPDPRRHAIVLTRRVLGRLLGRLTGRLAESLSHEHKTPAFTTDPNFAWDRALEACFWQVYLSDVAPWLPDWAWRVLNATLTTRGFARILRTVRSAGTEVLVLAGDPDFTRSTLGARRGIRAMQRRGGLQVTHLPGLDHAMMRPGDTAAVGAELTQFVLAHASAGTATPVELIPATAPQANDVAVSEAS